MKKMLNIAYLGNRDYIDVSTLSTALYEALPHITNNDLIRNLKIRLLKKVENECSLLLVEEGDSNLEGLSPSIDSAVIFNWDYENKNYTAYFQENSTVLSKRHAEIVDDPKDHMKYENEIVKIFNPINDDSIYNLMKMGRLIVVKKYNLYPRVVRFHFDRLYNKEELAGVTMKVKVYSAAKDFYLLETFKDDVKFGEIIIKGLQPY